MKVKKKMSRQIECLYYRKLYAHLIRNRHLLSNKARKKKKKEFNKESKNSELVCSLQFFIYKQERGNNRLHE